MIGIKNYRSGFFALAAASMLLGTGCDQVKDAAEQCVADFVPDCEASVLDGEASITGQAAIDGFFSSAVSFGNAASTVAGGIEAELDGIRDDFGLDADANLGADLRAELDAYVEGGITVRAEPARCELDTQLYADASVNCQAAAKCDVDAMAGSVAVECYGRCDVEVDVNAECGADATLVCEVEAPSVACEGRCEGTCTVQADAGVMCTGSCGGTCTGQCDGQCVGDTDDGAGCNGVCTGTCTGSCDAECEINLDVAAECMGSCTGSCTGNAGSIDCDADANFYCEGSADASVECTGGCDADIEPPSVMVDCEASASCNAQAKVEASVNVQCTPPSVEIAYELKAGIDAEAEAEFKAKLTKLRARLPKLLTAIRKADIVVDAGGELLGTVGTAASGVVDVIGDADLALDVKARLACVPVAIDETEQLLMTSRSKLQEQLSAAAELQSTLSI